MYQTRGCRFNAALALQTKEVWSIGTISFLAIYMLAWAIMSISYPDVFNTKYSRFFDAVSAIASISLLVISIMNFAFERPVKAEKLNRNALAISKLMRRLERELAAPKVDFTTLQDIAAEYENHIAETQVNHTQKDQTRWIYSKANSEKKITAMLFLFRRWAYDIWFYGSSMFMYAFVIISIVAPTLWYSIFVVLPALKHS